MKKILWVIFLLTSCGTTGKIIFYNFDKPELEVYSELIKIINDSSKFAVPLKWKDLTEGDAIEYNYVYFKENPEELYQIRFKYDSLEWAKSPNSTLALIAVYQESTKFQYNVDLSLKEKKRVQLRFETEILSHIKYAYTKSN